MQKLRSDADGKVEDYDDSPERQMLKGGSPLVKLFTGKKLFEPVCYCTHKELQQSRTVSASSKIFMA